MIQILVIVQSAFPCPGSNWNTNLVTYIARANHGFYGILKSNWRHCYTPTPPLPLLDGMLVYRTYTRSYS